jgi:uncharacterized protein YaaN involved in tellurite resistance
MAPKALFPTDVKPEDIKKPVSSTSQPFLMFDDDPFEHKPGTAFQQLHNTAVAQPARISKDIPMPQTPHELAKFNPNAGKVIAKYGNVEPMVLKLLTDFDTPAGIIKFGDDEMAEIARHSDAQLDAVKDVDVSYVETQLTQIMVLAKTMKLDTKPKDNHFSLHNLFQKVTGFVVDAKEQLTAEFTDVSSKIDGIISQVDIYAERIKTKLAGFETMYNDNIVAYQNLTLLITVAEQVRVIKAQELDELKASAGSDMLEIERINRLQGSLTRLDKKIVNLKKYQTMAIQTAPDITQMADQAIIILEKFADIKKMTIPLWKKSIRRYIDGIELRRAAMLEQSINDANNNLLQHNSNVGKDNAIAIAHMNNRDAIDDLTLETINRNLIDTIVEVATINKEGETNRKNSVDRMEDMKRLYASIATNRISIDEVKEERKKLQDHVESPKSKTYFNGEWTKIQIGGHGNKQS